MLCAGHIKVPSRPLPRCRSGFKSQEWGSPGYEVDNSYGMLAPARTPKPIIDKLNAQILRIVRLPEIRSKLESMGFDIVASTPAEHDAIVRAEIPKWAKVFKEFGIEPN